VTRLRRHLADPLFATSYLLLLAAAGAAVLGFAFWIVVARRLPAATFGPAGAVVSAMVFVSGASATGLGQVLVRFLPAMGRGAGRLVLTVYAASAAFTGVLALAGALSAPFWSAKLGFLAHDGGWTAGFVAGSIVLALFALQDAVLTGIRQARWIPVENVAYGIVRLAAVGAASAGTAAVAAAWAVPAAVAVAAVSLLLVLRLLPRHAAAAAADVRPRRVARFAVVNWLGSTLGLAAVTFTPIVVVGAVDARPGSRFYAAWTVLVGLSLIAVSTATSLTALAAADAAALRATTRHALKQVLALSAAAVAALAILAPQVMGLFGRDYADGAGTLRLLSLSILPFGVSMVGLGVARVRGALGSILAWEATLCGVGAVLLALLLPAHGIDGAALAWLAAQTAALAVAVAGCLAPVLGSHPVEVQAA
jgi:O-antigen/teichoic acid export membrane protein